MVSVYEILFSTYRILNFVGRDSFNTDLCLILLLGSASLSYPLTPRIKPTFYAVPALSATHLHAYSVAL